ncbi:unnamed protein product [Durusdinium trenchii]|uniref:Uncharacterized protein n=1 Tax=Durusdinium trenchii TaxID=1381693 RepID=A0ABP0P2D9_9DINO
MTADSQDVHGPKLAEVCMRQALRLEEMQEELEKARKREKTALEELEKLCKAHQQEKAAFVDREEQMVSLQAALQRENDLLLEELVSVLGRTKALKAEMAWIQRSLPFESPREKQPAVHYLSRGSSPSAVKAHDSRSPSNSQVISPMKPMLSPLQQVPNVSWLRGAEAPSKLIHPMRRASEVFGITPATR